jgi:hypothetical protein
MLNKFSGLKRKVLSAALASCLLQPASMFAQMDPPEVDPMPVPRNEFGHPSFAGTPERVGNWQGLLGSLANRGDRRPFNIEESLMYEDVPFQPWAAELHAERIAKGGAYDPHTRCKPSGGARMFHTPYGMEFLDLGSEVIIVNVGAPHSWRRIWVDGRDFPADIEPGWYGYSIGHWEDDTLVVETKGFNTGFWISRGGYPHTEQLTTIEKFSRPDWGRLRYEITIDDPGAYTKPWTGGWYMTWGDGVEPFDYLCQENNRDPERMLGIDR